MFKRNQLLSGLQKNSAFLWGARQTGKSTLLKMHYPESLYYDLLMTDVYLRLNQQPWQLREYLINNTFTQPVIIDEIQLIPQLLSEVHWLIENKGIQFILSGSSPRKILKQNVNLLGGRAIKYQLFPLSYSEIPDFNLLKALNHGLLPVHYLDENPEKKIAAYIGSYLRDEILTEAINRKVATFSRFLEVAALTNGEILNYTNIASECGISSPTVKEYFQILTDTMTGNFLPSFQKKPKRRLINAPKYYFFDIGIVNFLLKRKQVEFGSEVFGKAFEHFIYQEILAYSEYSGLNFEITYWRTATHTEVDFVIGDHETAIEVKSSNNVNERHLKGLLKFAEDYSTKNLFVVSNDPYRRQIGKVVVLPWKMFLDMLWNGEIVA